MGPDVTLPNLSLARGESIWLSSDENALRSYFGDCIQDDIFHQMDDEYSPNGNDVIQVFELGLQIELYLAFANANLQFSNSWSYKDLEGTQISISPHISAPECFLGFYSEEVVLNL